MSTRQVDQRRHRFAMALQSALSRDDVVQSYFDSVGQVINAHGLGLYELDENGAVVDVRATVADELLDGYEEYGRQDDPVLSFVVHHRRPIDSSRVVSSAAWESCGARSALGTIGHGHSLEAPIVASGAVIGTINFSRPDRDQAFTDEDLASARLVSEQLGLATERALRFEMTGHRASTLEHALDRLPHAVIVSDLDTDIIFCNRTARNSLDLATGDGAGKDVVAAAVDEAMESFRIEGKRVFTRSVWDDATGRQSIVKSFRLSDKDRTAVTLVFPGADTSSAPRLPAWDVLTPREQEIAELVSAGLTSKQIAEKAFISENTVKQHLKRVFAKTDVANRAELVQLIWSSGASLSGATDDSKPVG